MVSLPSQVVRWFILLRRAALVLFAANGAHCLLRWQLLAMDDAGMAGFRKFSEEMDYPREKSTPYGGHMVKAKEEHNS